MGVVAGDSYDLALAWRAAGAALPGLRAELIASSGGVLASADLTAANASDLGPWQRATATLVASHTEPRAHLRLTLAGPGRVDLDDVSLFPRKTWKNRPGGLRADMVQALADMKPGFLRFPGGCIVEGSVLARRYQWKKTLGPVEERPLLFNRWNDEFKHRPTPDYFQTFGLGFYEFFLLCADIGAEPLPILNCGMACQFNSGELVPLEQLDPYIQDALDLIEFANGPVTSTWGARRAALGHPAPFHLKMLGIGNEQWGPAYMERYARFAEVLRAKHPEIALIGAAGPAPDDERFDYAWKQLRALKTDLIDEHAYGSPEWFLDNTRRYDGYDREGPKVFMGEWAAQTVKVTSPDNRNTWGCALAEAAYMTGMERNADVVRMAAYAPLFGHVDAWQWTPNLLWSDNLRTLRTANYHVQALFARNRGDRVLPVTLDALTGDEARRLYVSSTWDAATGEVLLKLVNALTVPATANIALTGARELRTGTRTTLHSDDLDAVNTLDNPAIVAPHEEPFAPGAATFPVTLPARSVTLLRIGVGTPRAP